MPSASVCVEMKARIGASVASALATRSALVRKRGSFSSSATPSALYSRSTIACIDADIEIQRPSLVGNTLRGQAVLERLPVRGLILWVNW